MYWTKCKVIECEPNRVFTFAVMTGGKPVNTWSYRLEPVGDRTNVTESFALTPTLPLRIYWTLFGWARQGTNERGMRTTLERIKAVVERAGSNRPSGSRRHGTRVSADAWAMACWMVRPLAASPMT